MPWWMVTPPALAGTLPETLAAANLAVGGSSAAAGETVTDIAAIGAAMTSNRARMTFTPSTFPPVIITNAERAAALHDSCHQPVAARWRASGAIFIAWQACCRQGAAMPIGLSVAIAIFA